MKKTVFGLFAISILIFVYFITYFVVLNHKQNEIFHEIVEESKKNNDYELFLKYQPNAHYHKLIEHDSVVNENYLIKAYQVIQTDNQSLLVIFVQVLNDDYDIEKYAIYVDGKFNGYSNFNQYTLVGLEPNKSYNITIEAIDFVGRTSKLSEPFVYNT